MHDKRCKLATCALLAALFAGTAALITTTAPQPAWSQGGGGGGGGGAGGGGGGGGAGGAGAGAGGFGGGDVGGFGNPSTAGPAAAPTATGIARAMEVADERAAFLGNNPGLARAAEVAAPEAQLSTLAESIASRGMTPVGTTEEESALSSGWTTR